MDKLIASGVLCFRTNPKFFLLQHKDRWNIPKGYVDKGEDEIACAWRELYEETGILRTQVELDIDFRFQIQYQIKPPYVGNRLIEKTYVIFLGYMVENLTIKLTEYLGFQWFPWNPPHHIQEWLIDPLLEEVNKHLAVKG